MSVEALQALLAEFEGRKPSASQAAKIQRFKRAIIAEGLADYLAETTQAEYKRLAGISDQTLQNHIRRLDVPLNGKKVDVVAMLRALHTWLSKDGIENRGKNLRRTDSQETPENLSELTDDEIGKLDLRDQKTAYEIQNLKLKKRHSELDLERAQGNMVDRDEWKLRISWLSSRLASVGHQLGKKVNPEAQRIFNELLEGMEADLLDEIKDAE